MNLYMSNNKQSVLAALMKECDVDDIQLSKHTGVPASTINRTRLGRNSNPTASTLKPLSDFFKVSIDSLLGREELPKDRIPGFHQRDRYATSILPVIQWQDVNNYINNTNSFNNSKFLKWISSEKSICEGSFAVYVPNDALALFLKKGSTILIDRSQDIISGDIALLQINKKIIGLKKILIDGDKIFIKSITPGINSIDPIKNNHLILGKIIETRYPVQDNGESSPSASVQNSNTYGTNFVKQNN
jgi:SOS-response transcriptional repressor LexA